MITELDEDFDCDFDHGPECPRCGGDMRWIDCDQCSGEGGTDAYELSPIEYEPGEVIPCDFCESEGGWYGCANSYEWCNAHPLPGHEQASRFIVGRAAIGELA